MISAIIQARMNSTRLPGKVMMTVNDKPLLSYMCERVRLSRRVEQVIFATTVSPCDSVIADWCRENNVLFYRGSEDDVLNRYYEAAKHFGASIIVRLTSDCPLIDPQAVDNVIDCYQNRFPKVDFVSNTVPLPCLYPDGMDVEVFNSELLEKTNREARLPSEREHVTFYMWKTGKFSAYRLDPPQDFSRYRFTIDYPQDFEVVKTILNHFYRRNPRFTMLDIIEFMAGRPDLRKLQQGIERNAGWKKALARDKEFMDSSNE